MARDIGFFLTWIMLQLAKFASNLSLWNFVPILMWSCKIKHKMTKKDIDYKHKRQLSRCSAGKAVQKKKYIGVRMMSLTPS